MWTNVDGCFTNFPPPPGFTGFQQDKWGDDDYYRVLTPDETKQYEAVLADWAAEDAAEVAGRLADDEARRRYFFDIEEEEQDGPQDGPPAEEPTSEPLLLTDATEPTSEDPPSENAPTSEDPPSENAPTSEDQPSEAPATEPLPPPQAPDEATDL